MALLIFIISNANAEISNISTRGLAGSGDNRMIAGFNINGEDSMKVAIIAGGPTLSAFGVPNVLNDPKLTVYNSAGAIIASNDDWNNDPDITASSTVPQSDREAGVTLTLSPGSYTVHVESADNQVIGNAIVAIENIDTVSTSVLSNISTRGQVGSNDEQMIAGFILKGSSQRLVMVAAGPTLSDFGLNNVLSNPTMTLLDGTGKVIDSNDDWGNDASVAASSLKPSYAKEAGISATLAAGSYTIVIGGSNGETGNAIIGVEDYAISVSNGANNNCIDVALPAVNSTITLAVSNIKYAEQIVSGTMTTTVDSISDTQKTTSSYSVLNTQGIDIIANSVEIEDYSITDNQQYLQKLSISGNLEFQGIKIPFSASSTASPAELVGPIKHYCEQATWTSPSVQVETVVTGNPSTIDTPVYTGIILSINDEINIAAGAFNAIKIERTSTETKSLEWIDSDSGFLIRQETYDATGSTLQSSITATSVN